MSNISLQQLTYLCNNRIYLSAYKWCVFVICAHMPLCVSACMLDIKGPLLLSSVSTLLHTLSLCGFHCTYQASWPMSSWKFYCLSRLSLQEPWVYGYALHHLFLSGRCPSTPVLTLQCISYPLNQHFLIVIPIYREEMNLCYRRIKIIWRAIIMFFKRMDYSDRLDCLRLYFVKLFFDLHTEVFVHIQILWSDSYKCNIIFFVLENQWSQRKVPLFKKNS